MKKIISLIISCLFLLSAGVGCNSKLATIESTVVSERINSFETYDDLQIITYKGFTGKIDNSTQHVTNGEHSMKLEIQSPRRDEWEGTKNVFNTAKLLFKPTNRIYSYDLSLLMNKAVSLKLDVFNANQKEVFLCAYIKANNKVLYSDACILKADSANKVELNINPEFTSSAYQRLDEIVLSFYDKDIFSGGTFYLDNLIIESKDTYVSPIKTFSDSSEILNFASFEDMSYVAALGNTSIPTGYIRYSQEDIFLNGKGGIKYTTFGLTGNPEMTLSDVTREMQMSGIEVLSSLLKSKNFSDLKNGGKIRYSLYNASSLQKNFYTLIGDSEGNYITHTSTAAPQSKIEIEVSDFSGVDINKISTFKIMYDNVYDYESFNFYVSSIKIA